MSPRSLNPRPSFVTIPLNPKKLGSGFNLQPSSAGGWFGSEPARSGPSFRFGNSNPVLGLKLRLLFSWLLFPFRASFFNSGGSFSDCSSPSPTMRYVVQILWYWIDLCREYLAESDIELICVLNIWHEDSFCFSSFFFQIVSRVFSSFRCSSSSSFSFLIR